MNRRRFLQGFAGAALLPVASAFAQDDPLNPLTTPVGFRETHRLRIVNRVDGAISVSTNRGNSWQLIGRVLIPATTVVQGYIAAEYADPGSVAAIAVHGHRIRVSSEDASLHAPLILSLDPKEYAGKMPNAGYGGHRPGSAGIYTSIPAGVTLFRELAPHVGNAVLREDPDRGTLVPLSNRFKPDGAGEIIIIPVNVPVNALTEVEFENKQGGAVTATFADGTSQVLTQVIKPVEGIGRFDGTAYTGVGRLNTAHTGVVTVCTAPVDGALPEGVGKERRGGFQISPAWHNARCEEAGAAMVMTVGTPGVPRHKEWEGKAPLFRDAMCLASGPDPSRTGIVDMSVDNGAWEPITNATGLQLDLFTGTGLTRYWKRQGIKRAAQKGVTAFRLRLPVQTDELVQTAALAAARNYFMLQRSAATQGKLPIISGSFYVDANPDKSNLVAWARLLIEGRPKGLTNSNPPVLSWDTTKVADGEYLVETEALDSNGVVIAKTKRRVFVSNKS